MIYFPHPLQSDDEGIVAIGGDLSYERLKFAYSCGIFPWFNQEPIIWWFTHPRCILYPSKVKVSKSMRSVIRNASNWKVTVNHNFEEVIQQCSNIKRSDQHGTWITSSIKNAYIDLHLAGSAHSVEVWENGELIGGLYGVSSGKIFFGESMFAKKSNSSKYALIHLSKYLEHLGCRLIDCQQDTPHIRSMGATLVSKEDFWHEIKRNMMNDDLPISKSSFSDWLDQSA